MCLKNNLREGEMRCEVKPFCPIQLTTQPEIIKCRFVFDFTLQAYDAGLFAGWLVDWLAGALPSPLDISRLDSSLLLTPQLLSGTYVLGFLAFFSHGNFFTATSTGFEQPRRYPARAGRVLFFNELHEDFSRYARIM